MLVLLLLLEIFSIFSLTSPFLISKVHLNVNSTMKLMPSYWIGTPKPLMMFTFFSSPFLPVLAREMELLGSVTYIGIYIWIDAYICCVCVLSLYPIRISFNKVIYCMQLAHVIWRLIGPKICTVSWISWSSKRADVCVCACACACACARVCVCVCVRLSCVWLCATPWTAAHQAPPSMEFSKQEYWNGLPFPSPGDLSDPEIESRFPALQVDSLPPEPPGKTDGVVVLSKSHFPLCSSSTCNTFVSNSLYFIPSI